MDWRDEGILLSSRRHGESSAIAEVFTREHGRHMGVVRGGGSRRMAPILQPGARLALEWRARLDEHMGAFRVEPLPSRTALVLGDRAALAALGSVTALLSACLAEREAHGTLYARTLEFLEALGLARDWPGLYAGWELALLADMGFGLDLSACAVTGRPEGLAWVSPRSGRAVSREAGAPWAEKLLDLPAFLRDGWEEGAALAPGQVAAALRLSGHFLHARLAPALAREVLPPARDRAVEAILRAAEA